MLPNMNIKDTYMRTIWVTTKILNSASPELTVIDSHDPKFKDWKTHDAFLCSMAAPTFFPLWEVNGQTYVDGCMVANNPCEIIYQRGKDMAKK